MRLASWMMKTTSTCAFWKHLKQVPVLLRTIPTSNTLVVVQFVTFY